MYQIIEFQKQYRNPYRNGVESLFMQPKLRLALSLLWIALCRGDARAQTTHPASGREIAPVMGMGGADWLVRSEREKEEAPDAALDAIGIRKGDLVGDVGAGVGYFTSSQQAYDTLHIGDPAHAARLQAESRSES